MCLESCRIEIVSSMKVSAACGAQYRLRLECDERYFGAAAQMAFPKSDYSSACLILSMEH
jgi:hypothetical protein